MGQFFKIFPNLSQDWLKFKKILEKLGDFAQNLAQNWTNWYMNRSLFQVEKLVFVWVYVQIPRQHVPSKTKLEYPLGLVYIINAIMHVSDASCSQNHA